MALNSDDIQDPDVFTDVMIDIETMSTHPSNSLVLSIGAIQFRARTKFVQIGAQRLWVPPMREQLLRGREVTKDTQKFWAGQPEAAQRDWLEPPETPVERIHRELSRLTFCAPRVWARGDVFDLGNLITLFRNHGLQEPWEYNAARDSRGFCTDTKRLRDATYEDGILYTDDAGVLRKGGLKIIPHTGISDCIVQAFDVWRHWDFEAHSLPHHSV